MRKLKLILGASTLLLVSMQVNAGIINDFMGYYNVSNWTTTLDGNGSVNTSGAPDSVLLTGPDDSSSTAGSTSFTIAAAASGPVTFDWDFATDDVSASWDPFGYILNGGFNELTDPRIDGQAGTTSFLVSEGDVFGFSQTSIDSDFGVGLTTISDFSAPGPGNGAVPEPSIIALFAAGFIGIGLTRRRMRN